MIRSRLARAAAVLLTLGTVAGPVTADDGQSLRVVADITPVKALVEAVLEGTHKVDLLIDAQASVHHHSLRPSDARKLAGADIVFNLGEGLSPWLGSAMRSIGAGVKSVELQADYSFADASLQDDPHTWLDPLNAIQWLPRIADELAILDPAHGVSYRINAERASKMIEAEIRKVDERSATLAERDWLVYHDSLGWFSARFDLQPAGVVTHADDTPPTAPELAGIRSLVRSRHADCLLVEQGVSPRAIAAIDESGSLPVYTIDPLGRTLPGGADFYPALIESLASTIDNCV